MNKGTENDINALKRERASIKRKFTRKCNAFLDLSRQNEKLLVLQEKFSDIREAFKELDRVSDHLIAVINQTVSHDLMDSMLEDCDTYMKETESTLDHIRAELASHMSGNSSKQPEMHVKPLNAPQFSGNIREYPSFRQDFTRLMTRSYGNDPYVLRSCLLGPALSIVRGVEDNFDEMLSRLDHAFGDPRKLVDAVIYDIKSLKPIADGESKKFITMVNVIERCWLDLQRMDLSVEMDTVTMVSMIERLLPPMQKREWILRQDSKFKVSHVNMFQELLAYLLQEKRVIEYMEHDVRTVAQCRNTVHQTFGTESVNQDISPSTNDEEAKNDFQKNQSICQKHILEEIEKVTNRLEHIMHIANTTGNDLLKADTFTTSNERQRNWCWLHKTTGHFTETCSKFIRMPHDEKLIYMRQAGACFNCLQTGHLARDCTHPSRCQATIAGRKCGRRHHLLLHRKDDSKHATQESFVHTSKAQNHSTLLAISKVKCHDQNLTVLWDSGADISLITHSAASRLDLKGDEVELSIIKVGHDATKIKSDKYHVRDRPGEQKMGHLCIWYGCDHSRPATCHYRTYCNVFS